MGESKAQTRRRLGLLGEANCTTVKCRASKGWASSKIQQGGVKGCGELT